VFFSSRVDSGESNRKSTATLVLMFNRGAQMMHEPGL